MHGGTWINIQHNVQYFCTAISVLINAFLIHLIANKSCKALGTYKYLLAYTSTFEIIYSIVDFLASPIFYSHSSVFLMFVVSETSFFKNIPMLINVFNGLYCANFGTVLGLFSLQFYYRYLIAKNSALLKTFKSVKILFWMSIPLISGSVWFFATYVLAAPSQTLTDHVREHIMTDLDIDIDTTEYLGLFFFPRDKNGTPYIQVKDITSHLIQDFDLTITLISIFYFGIACYKEISKNMVKSVSTSYQVLQSQLFYALVAQTTIPLILLNFPVLSIHLCAIAGKDLGHLSGIVTITLALYPVIDPLPNIFIINGYRKATKEYLQLLICRKRNVTPIVNSRMSVLKNII